MEKTANTVPVLDRPSQAAPMLVKGVRYATLWVPDPRDADGHCEVYRAFPRRVLDGRPIPGMFKLWKRGQPILFLQRDMGGIVTCSCADYWKEGDCNHVQAAIETGLV